MTRFGRWVEKNRPRTVKGWAEAALAAGFVALITAGVVKFAIMSSETGLSYWDMVSLFE